ncbi:hypothetical protein ACGRPC_18630 [Vibrio diabolicus]|uniref:hypothetical protein n=1 Tax=Vibrio diabolicus TaxID=50719 RepID=UPI003749774D
MEVVVVKCSNISGSSAETQHLNHEYIDFWGKVAEFFEQNSIVFEGQYVRISLEIDDVLNMLDNLKLENLDGYFNRLREEAEASGKFELPSPYGAEFKIKFIETPDSELWDSNYFAHRFVELLFLAMNLCKRGACNLANFHLSCDKRPNAIYVDSIESAWHSADQNRWPLLKELDFNIVWNWLVKNGGLEYSLAKTSVTKAIAVLLSLSYSTSLISPSEVVQVSQVIESFLINKNEPKARALEKKLPVLFGNPPNKLAKWPSQFYKLRSDIVHGEYPIFRPRFEEVDEHFDDSSEYYWKLVDAVYAGMSIILAIAQDLALEDADRYTFQEKIIVSRDKA